MRTSSTTHPAPRAKASDAGRRSLLAGVVLAATLLASGSASAEKSVNRKSRADVLNSWTVEQLAAAQPRWRQVPSSVANGRQAPSPLAGQQSQTKRVAGSPPKVEVEADLTRRLLPAKRRTTQK